MMIIYLTLRDQMHQCILQPLSQSWPICIGLLSSIKVEKKKE